MNASLSEKFEPLSIPLLKNKTLHSFSVESVLPVQVFVVFFAGKAEGDFVHLF